MGQSERCGDVLCELVSRRPTFVALQETKLGSLDASKCKTFLPTRISSHVYKPSVGASGGILSAWDDSICSLRSSTERAYSLTTTLVVNRDNSLLTVTNVYGPTSHDDKPAFLAELLDIADSISEPWVIMGDFNLIRFPGEINNDNFDASEANLFNDTINSLEIVEIPLVDRAYTWSNKRDVPTLVRLDRVFVNLMWDAAFPNTALSSLTRYASDHVPLLLHAYTKTPKGCCFRFENAWLHHQSFKEAINAKLDNPSRGSSEKSFVKLLKNCRHVCRSWAK